MHVDYLNINTRFVFILKKTVLTNITSDLYITWKCIQTTKYVQLHGLALSVLLKLSVTIDVMEYNYRIVRPVRTCRIPRDSLLRVLNVLLILLVVK